MAVPFILPLCIILFLSHPFPLSAAGEEQWPHCPQNQYLSCANQTFPLQFPYSLTTYPRCGLCLLNCTKDGPAIIYLYGGNEYMVDNFSSPTSLKVSNPWLGDLIRNKSCLFIDYWNPPNTSSLSVTISPSLTVFKCPDRGEYAEQVDAYFRRNNYSSNRACSGYNLFFKYPIHHLPAPAPYPSICSVLNLPVKSSPNNTLNTTDLFSLLSSNFHLALRVTEVCLECRLEGGRCPSYDRNDFTCLHKKPGKGHSRLVLMTVIPGGIILLLCLLVPFVRYRKKQNPASSYAFARNTSFEPSSKADPEGGNAYFGVHLYPYTELEDATNKFDSSKELGDGGFGTVYHGQLKDGQEVAVKRLYEHNYKRMTQFMNEIEILTRLSHPNLVSLYGCTSHRSKELLLVYEYIPNGTVADHLHGDRAEDASLTWPIRMNIAVETASALVYLHENDIIHRDVKTTNILLDNNFRIKVADFGLSRLFPFDVTHVSTAPQGTPGYVDPEYHQCYQLTDKSDVYSFGVVLIELVSSKPAVDITRHKHEINLANFAVNRIQNRAFHELIDPSVGSESDSSVEIMIMAVAELAFRCLQTEKEMRPTMEEVLKSLKEIQEQKEEKTGEELENAGGITRARSWVEGDDVVFLKNSKGTTSPDSVTERWLCCSTTSVSSG